MAILFTPHIFIFFSISIFAIGLIIGSFLNVLIFRIPEGKSIVYPPSACPECGERIRFYDNIPVLSYIFLAGRCRKCGFKISPVYPFVELATGFLLLALFYKYFYDLYFFYQINKFNFSLFEGLIFQRMSYLATAGVFIIILIPIFFIDFFHKIIPDSLNILLIILGFLLNIFLVKTSFLLPLYGFLAGGVFFFLIAVAYEKLRKVEGLGGGDIKLIAGIGAFLGLKGVMFTIFAGSVLALFGFAIAYVFFNSYGDRKIPFGPFLSIAAVVYVFYGYHLVNLYINLFAGR